MAFGRWIHKRLRSSRLAWATYLILLAPSPTDTHTFTHTYIYGFRQGVVAYTYNPSIQEAKAGRLLQVQGQPDLHEMLSQKREKREKEKKRKEKRK